MKITKVSGLHLRLPDVKEIFDGTQDVLIVKVETNAGIIGYGEVVSGSAIAKAVIEAPRSAPRRHGLGQALIGADPLDPASCWQIMYDASRWYGRQGVAIHAMSGVDQALWDIVGKAAAKPLCEVWGKKRSRVRAYASVLFPSSAVDAGHITRQFVDRGFTAVKFGWGSFGHNQRHDDDLLGAIVAAADTRAEIMVDAGRCWSLDQALRRAPALFDNYQLTWLEEPLHEDDLKGYRQLCNAVQGRIAAGETEAGLESFAELLDCGVKCLQPDVGRAGSLAACRAASELARQRGAWCVPHCYGTGINLAASLHWMASVEDAPFIEYPMTDSDLRNRLVRNVPEQNNGFVSVPEGPGLGVDVDEKVVRQFEYR